MPCLPDQTECQHVNCRNNYFVRKCQQKVARQSNKTEKIAIKCLLIEQGISLKFFHNLSNSRPSGQAKTMTEKAVSTYCLTLLSLQTDICQALANHQRGTNNTLC